MTIRTVLTFSVVGISCYSAPFQNLDFDNAITNNVRGGEVGVFSGSGPTSELLPGWVLRQNDSPVPLVFVDAFFSSRDYASIYPTNVSPSRAIPVEGKYSFAIYPGPGNVFSLSQRGDIPPDANSLQFMSYSNPFNVFINDQPATVMYRGVPGLSRTVIVDTSAFSGQTVDLKFTTLWQEPGKPLISAGIDSISFSTEFIPEPGTHWLTLLGGALSILWFRTHKSTSSNRN